MREPSINLVAALTKDQGPICTGKCAAVCRDGTGLVAVLALTRSDISLLPSCGGGTRVAALLLLFACRPCRRLLQPPMHRQLAPTRTNEQLMKGATMATLRQFLSLLFR